LKQGARERICTLLIKTEFRVRRQSSVIMTEQTSNLRSAQKPAPRPAESQYAMPGRQAQARAETAQKPRTRELTCGELDLLS
jgi:hypothetical protein